MKRYSTDRRNWKRVPKQDVKIKILDDTTVVYLKALEITEPLIIPTCGENCKIMDLGYQWLFICKAEANHIVTAHCDPRGEAVHWYIDIIDAWNFDQSGFSYFDDLYLDLNVLPDGRAEILDQDELEQALSTGLISQTQYALARHEAEQVYQAIQQKTFMPIQQTSTYLRLFQ
jgi:predicted RNA-binding protein associated with RNAse of E/G family